MRDPNEVVNSTIRNVCQSLVQAGQVTKADAIVIYLLEIMRGSLNNDIAFSTVFGEWPGVYHQD